MRYSYILFLFFITSCSDVKLNRITNAIFIKNFNISNYSFGEIKWTLKCKYSEIYEEDNTIKCKMPNIYIYKKDVLSSEMKSQYGYADLLKRIFYLEKNALVKSHTENIWLTTDKIYFDYKTEVIFSNSPTKIYKNNLTIYSQGFEAKSDLSNIKIKKHTTQITNN
ncbi:MAG: LPS export ABC transporter periplasmic protein LptC [Elusimicrobiales bacterium]|nr:LPS export ABC transporter periplasmic protein LptC [Elusimicrobiales bacterium]